MRHNLISRSAMLLLVSGALLNACDKKDAASGASSEPKAIAQPEQTTPDAPQPVAEKSDATPVVANTDKAPVADKSPVKVTSAVKKKEPPKLDKAEAKSNRNTLLPLLRDGRKAVQSGDYQKGIELFEKSIAIDPNDARVLSELGWALYKSGQIERAEKITRESVKHARDNNVKGASLYNLGRIEEDRGKRDDAAQHYTESLAVRPGNKIVQKRLDDLLAGGAAQPSLEESCDFKQMAGKVELTAQAVCAAYIKTLPPPDQDDEYAEPASCGEAQHPTLKVGAYTLIPFTYTDGQELGITYFVGLAAVSDSGWYVSTIGYAYNPGMGYIYEEFSVDAMESKNLIAGQSPQAVLTMTHNRTDGNYSMNEAEGSILTFESALDLSGPVPRWIATVDTYNEESFDRMLDDEDDGIDHGPNFPRKTSYTSTVTWKEGGYSVVSTGKMKHRAGEFTFERADKVCPF